MDFAEHVKSSVDIVKTIGEYVRLKNVRGSPRYMGLCPFHNEKTPSFSVHGGMQIYKCFGCGAGGDVFKFVMERERIGFYDALKMLAERNGIPVPKREYADADSKLRDALSEMHDAAAGVFQGNLRSAAGAEARAYLASRGVSHAQAEEFGLGLADPSGQQLTRRFEGRFAPDVLEQSGLVMKRQDGSGFFDRFRGRLIFPIHGETGKVIGFGARALKPDDQPKYLNSPETALYHKTYVLYNLHRAKDAIRSLEHAVLVEGYMDVIGVYSAGIRNVVASCGTALTNTQVRALKRHSERVVVNFDPDAAGAKAAERSIQMLLDEGLHVRVLELDAELDPDEYVKRQGAGAYRSRLDQAPAYFHWLAGRARKRFDVRTVEGRMEAFKFVAPSIQRIPDRLERFAVANDIAGNLGVDPKMVRDHFSGNAKQPRVIERSAPVPPAEKLLLNSLLASAEARAEVLPHLKQVEAVERMVLRNVFKTMFTIYESGGAFRYSDLEGRLGEADRDLLSSVIFADEQIEGQMALEQAAACLRSLRAQEPQAELAAVRARFEAAEREGDFSAALELMEEIARLKRVLQAAEDGRRAGR